MVRRFKINLRLHPAIRITEHQHFGYSLAQVWRCRVKNTILKKKSVTGCKSQIADLHVFRIKCTCPHFKRFGTQVGLACKQCHAGVGLMKISQAVADLYSHARQSLMPKIAWNANVAMPTTAKAGNVRA